VQRALRAHGQRIAEQGLAIRRTDGGHHHLIGLAAFLDA
jgi:hypothetical protein